MYPFMESGLGRLDPPSGVTEDLTGIRRWGRPPLFEEMDESGHGLVYS